MRFVRSVFSRAGSRALALVIASVVCMGALHTAWDDPACDPIPVHHDHNAHRIKSGTQPAPQDHCLFCHSLRSLRNGLVATHAPVADTARAAAIRPSSVVHAGCLLRPSGPSRAPPSILL